MSENVSFVCLVFIQSLKMTGIHITQVLKSYMCCAFLYEIMNLFHAMMMRNKVMYGKRNAQCIIKCLCRNWFEEMRYHSMNASTILRLYQSFLLEFLIRVSISRTFAISWKKTPIHLYFRHLYFLFFLRNPGYMPVKTIFHTYIKNLENYRN